jgi:hypothetical protein
MQECELPYLMGVVILLPQNLDESRPEANIFAEMKNLRQIEAFTRHEPVFNLYEL